MFPAAFFEPFQSAQAGAYNRLLLELFAESRRASQPLRLDLVLDLIISHLPAGPDPLADAHAALARLEAAGWLRTEIQPDYKPACVLTPAAFVFLQTQAAPPAELAEVMVTTADLLMAALTSSENDARLAAAVRLSDQALTLLKLRQHNASTETLPDTSALRAAVLAAAAKLEARGYAAGTVVRERYESFERLLADIAVRQSHGPAARPERPAGDLAGQLAAVITSLASVDKKAFGKQAEPLVNLYGTAALSAEPPAPAEPFVPDDPIWPQPTQAEIASARGAVAHEFNRPISAERVARQAAALLGGRPYVRAADLVLEGRADLPLLIQLRLHAGGELGYTIEDQPWVELKDLVFRDFIVRNASYVEPPAAGPSAEEQPAAEGEGA